MNRILAGIAGAMVMLAAGCGGATDTSKVKDALRYKEFQFFWTEGAKIDLPELPPESAIEIHSTYIIVDAKDGWRIVIPMDNIRFINVASPV